MTRDVGSVPMADPLACFLTWPTYGSWLPGDQRGWVKYHHGHQLPDPVRERIAQSRMAEEACLLNRSERNIVEQTIRNHCQLRKWKLFAVNCRSNHLHVVVSANVHPDEIRRQLKAWCTRRLKENQRATTNNSPGLRENWWAERGSRRYIGDQKSPEAAIVYVCDGQDQKCD